MTEAKINYHDLLNVIDGQKVIIRQSDYYTGDEIYMYCGKEMFHKLSGEVDKDEQE